MMYSVRLSSLLRVVGDPFTDEVQPWGHKVITIAEVKKAIREKRFEEEPSALWSNWERDSDIERISYMVKYKDSTPLEIEVYPSGFDGDDRIGAMLMDGYHRFCAAIIRKDKRINVTVINSISAGSEKKFLSLFKEAKRVKQEAVW